MSFDALQRSPSKFLVYSGEAILKRRNQDDDTVEFYLEPDPEGHPFAKHRAGKLEHGSKFFITCFEIDESGEPINQELKLHLKRAISSGIRQANRNKWVAAAGALCRNTMFQAFVKMKISHMDKDEKKAFSMGLKREIPLNKSLMDGPWAEDVSAAYVRYRCGIKTRAMLGFDSKGTERFQKVREEYWAYMFDKQEA